MKKLVLIAAVAVTLGFAACGNPKPAETEVIEDTESIVTDTALASENDSTVVVEQPATETTETEAVAN